MKYENPNPEEIKNEVKYILLAVALFAKEQTFRLLLKGWISVQFLEIRQTGQKENSWKMRSGGPTD